MDKLIQNESDGGGARRLRSGRVRHQSQHESLKVREGEEGEAGIRGVQPLEPQICSFQDVNEQRSARPGGFKSVTPLLSAGAATLRSSHFSPCQRLSGWLDGWQTHTQHTHTALYFYFCEDFHRHNVLSSQLASQLTP